MIHSSAACSLPPISDIFALPRRGSNSSSSGMNYHHHHNNNNNNNNNHITTPPTTNYTHITNFNAVNNNNDLHHNYRQRERTNSSNKMSGYYPPLKAKRKRASPSQLSVLNRVFSQTYFPSTELRIELGKHLGMSPRTVQIWFQNKRQSLRSRTRRCSFSSMEYTGEEEEEEHPMDEEERNANTYFSTNDAQRYPYHPGCPSSPPWTPTSYSGPTGHDFESPLILPPPSSSSSSSPSSSSSSSPIHSPLMMDNDHQHQHHKINLPPLRLYQNSYYPPSPPSSTYPSPISIDSILQ